MKKAFTLAEVLITLAIIGVVAALTIPSVITNVQQQEFKTGLRKAVSALNSAITMNKALEGESPYDNTDLFNYLQQHMSVLKTANFGKCYSENGDFLPADARGGCPVETRNTSSNKVFYTTDGMRFEIPDPQYLGHNILSHENRMFLGFDTGKVAGCGSFGISDDLNGTGRMPCVIMVDVNGDKKPNAPDFGSSPWGEAGNIVSVYTFAAPTDKKLSDIFTIMITEEKAIPFGVVAQRAMYSK